MDCLVCHGVGVDLDIDVVQMLNRVFFELFLASVSFVADSYQPKLVDASV